MSNPLFASHMMQMAYLCKKQPPAELLGCWPLSTLSDKRDVSRYGHTYTGNLSSPSQTNPLANVIPQSNAGFVFELDLSKPFSVDFEIGISHGSGQSFAVQVTLGLLLVALGNNQGGQDYTSYAGTQLDTGYSRISYTGSHFAITYDGSKLYRFVNGVLNRSVSATLSGTSLGLSFPDVGNVWCFGNLRVVQKCLGTTAFPVPSGIYTGYETL